VGVASENGHALLSHPRSMCSKYEARLVPTWSTWSMAGDRHRSKANGKVEIVMS
jgi:hypothetical protein